MAALIPKTTPQNYTIFNPFNFLFTEETNRFLIDPNTSPPTVTPLHPDGTPYPPGTSLSDASANAIRKYAGVSTVDANGKIVPPPTTTPPQGNTTTGTGSPGNPIIEIDKRLVSDQLDLKYPLDLSANQTCIRFTSYDFKTVQKTTNDIYNVGAKISSLSDILSTATGAIEPIPYPTDKIKLYVPPNINVGYGANWGEASLGALGASGSGGGGLLGTLQEALGGAVRGITQTSINELVSKMSDIPDFNATGEQLIGLTTGLVFNKNEFSTFSNMQLRTFNYSFLMVARSEKEKNKINRIINTFKISMHPAGPSIGANGKITSSGGGTNTFTATARPPILKYPKLWTIEYCIGDSDKNNQYLPKTKFCAITGLNINYTPNSIFTTLTDGAIPAIQMDISFKELTPLIADQLIDGGLLGGPFAGSGVDENYNPKDKGTF